MCQAWLRASRCAVSSHPGVLPTAGAAVRGPPAALSETPATFARLQPAERSMDKENVGLREMCINLFIFWDFCC